MKIHDKFRADLEQRPHWHFHIRNLFDFCLTFSPLVLFNVRQLDDFSIGRATCIAVGVVIVIDLILI